MIMDNIDVVDFITNVLLGIVAVIMVIAVMIFVLAFVVAPFATVGYFALKIFELFV